MRGLITRWRFGVLVFAIALLLGLLGCRQSGLEVIHLAVPDYPIQARAQGMEGIVTVRVGIGVDGRVSYAAARGGNSLLVQAAEENAKTWLFKVPARSRFPLEQDIKYIFTLDKEGPANLIPTVVTNLPGSLEIIGTRARADELPVDTSAPQQGRRSR